MELSSEVTVFIFLLLEMRFKLIQLRVDQRVLRLEFGHFDLACLKTMFSLHKLHLYLAAALDTLLS
jgi:hypothetical protein